MCKVQSWEQAPRQLQTAREAARFIWRCAFSAAKRERRCLKYIPFAGKLMTLPMRIDRVRDVLNSFPYGGKTLNLSIRETFRLDVKIWLRRFYVSVCARMISWQ